MIVLVAGLLAGATDWNPMSKSAPISPMIFTCESLNTELIVYKSSAADHLKLNIEGRAVAITFDNAVDSMSWQQDEIGKRYRVSYRSAKGAASTALDVFFVIPKGRDGVTEASFVLTEGKTSISKKCLRAPDGLPGWENKPEVWL